ncbi:hypothetical protein DFH08DRAFT_1086816 [Mycena albidolilacea]|uniref:Uncharacterized protein n=1 Tax=Mycena albidolilacea TaxID=1033008 RepID=A0AAD6ZBX2_9AGAR|nr:hypothetical protein DFH08DRAFT_1086816 [Mycena albidolilacea]
MTVKPTLLIIGPGLIGGSLLTEFLKTDQYVLTVMARSADQIAVLSTLGVKTIQAGLQDLEAIGSAWKPMIADDVEVAHASIQALKRSPKNASGGQKIFVQISGAGVYGHLFSPHNPIDTIYDDADPAIINSLSPTAPHRAVDLAWYNTSQELAGKVKIAIYILATDALENSKVDVLTNPYFNASTHVETTWFAVAERIGADLYAKGRIATPAPRSSGPEDDFYGGGLLNFVILKTGISVHADVLLDIQGTNMWGGKAVQAFNNAAIASGALGKPGDVIFLVFAFLARKSATMRSLGGLGFGVGISNIGAVFPELVIFHLPD